MLDSRRAQHFEPSFSPTASTITARRWCHFDSRSEEQLTDCWVRSLEASFSPVHCQHIYFFQKGKIAGLFYFEALRKLYMGILAETLAAVTRESHHNRLLIVQKFSFFAAEFQMDEDIRRGQCRFCTVIFSGGGMSAGACSNWGSTPRLLTYSSPWIPVHSLKLQWW